MSTTVDAEHGPYAARLREALPRLRERIAAAAGRAGRDPADVTVVAVTKTHPVEALEAAVAAGLTDLGENRVEELERKVAAFQDPVRWHMVGHVQGRKARRALEAAHLIHSVDSIKLAERLGRLAVESERRAAVLVQVNTSGEEQKSGLPADEAVEGIHRIAELEGLEIRGLMTMAPFVDDPEVLSGAFGRLRRIGEQLSSLTPRVGQELSMGMTNDLEIAVEEGSTMLRVGTALFGERAR